VSGTFSGPPRIVFSSPPPENALGSANLNLIDRSRKAADSPRRAVPAAGFWSAAAKPRALDHAPKLPLLDCCGGAALARRPARPGQPFPRSISPKPSYLDHLQGGGSQAGTYGPAALVRGRTLFGPTKAAASPRTKRCRASPRTRRYEASRPHSEKSCASAARHQDRRAHLRAPRPRWPKNPQRKHRVVATRYFPSSRRRSLARCRACHS
jgi:hypothetical protein